MSLSVALQKLAAARRALLGSAVAVTIILALVSAAPRAATPPQISAIEKLVAIEEIVQVQARYFRCVDTKDWACWRALFAPDLVMGGVKEGPDGMIKHVQDNGLYDRVKTVFYGHMPEVEILSPTTARAVFAADFQLYYALGQPYPTTGKEAVALGKASHTYASYHTTFVKIGGTWMLQTIDIVPRRRDDLGGITIPALPAQR